ncbi:MAG: glucose-1-phosphate cytidylyltransferase [Clostridiaceae bacterium]|nr:glucose-1-phosphate cytidylyltransferase [Clostridiaceae bacterium]
MKVVIFCGGLGTRLKEETEFRPKPMVFVGDRPILWHIMKIYSNYGFNDFVLCLGYKGEVIKKYFLDYELLHNDFTLEMGNKDRLSIHKHVKDLDWKITFAETGADTLKGGRLKKIEKYIEGDSFMLTYGDGVADINIQDLLSFHQSHGRIGTVSGVRPPSLFGELLVENQEVILFSEKPQTSKGLINGGFFVFNRAIFDYLSEAEDCDFEVGPLEELARDKQLMVYEHRGNWACMDTPRDMNYLNRMWASGQAFWKTWKG